MGYVEDMSICNWKEMAYTIDGEITFKTECGSTVTLTASASDTKYSYCPFCARELTIYRFDHRQHFNKEEK